MRGFAALPLHIAAALHSRRPGPCPPSPDAPPLPRPRAPGGPSCPQVRLRTSEGGFVLSHVDAVVDDMLRKDYLFDIALPHIPNRCPWGGVRRGMEERTWQGLSAARVIAAKGSWEQGLFGAGVGAAPQMSPSGVCRPQPSLCCPVEQ
jgi:hypothetical protein